MKNQTCSFTGHRHINPHDYQRMKKRLYEEIEKLIAEGYCFFGAGGALGFDTEASLAVLNLKRKYPHIKLILVLPFWEQAEGWPAQDIAVYEHIKSKADKVKYTAEHYHSGCYYKRNRHLVNSSSVCIAYMNKTSGGTAYTVNYATEQNVRVIHIAK